MKPEQDRVSKLLSETVTLLCKNGLQYRDELRIEGVIGVTIDNSDVFVIHVNEAFGLAGSTQPPPKGIGSGYISQSTLSDLPHLINSTPPPKPTGHRPLSRPTRGLRGRPGGSFSARSGQFGAKRGVLGRSMRVRGRGRPVQNNGSSQMMTGQQPQQSLPDSDPTQYNTNTDSSSSNTQNNIPQIEPREPLKREPKDQELRRDHGIKESFINLSMSDLSEGGLPLFDPTDNSESSEPPSKRPHMDGRTATSLPNISQSVDQTTMQLSQSPPAVLHTPDLQEIKQEEPFELDFDVSLSNVEVNPNQPINTSQSDSNSTADHRSMPYRDANTERSFMAQDFDLMPRDDDMTADAFNHSGLRSSLSAHGIPPGNYNMHPRGNFNVNRPRIIFTTKDEQLLDEDEVIPIPIKDDEEIMPQPEEREEVTPPEKEETQEQPKDVPTIPCPLCDLKFRLKMQMKAHLKEEHGAKHRLKCHLCDREFSSNQYLKMHIDMHKGMAAYTCNICQKNFSQKGHYLGHMNKHAGAKPFQCKACLKCFTYQQQLTNHKKSCIGTNLHII